MKLLKHFSHENVISIYDILNPVSPQYYTDVYIVSELMDTDLHQIISSPQELSDDHVQYFLYQLLKGLRYIHSAHVLHRDLKPSNLLVNGNCDLKICDFGLARAANPEENHAGFMTEYVATRWYRAPEIMLSWREYTKAVDMWSVGCILAELLARQPLFPGTNYVNQLHLILEILGSPSLEDTQYIESERARSYIHNLPQRPGIPFSQLFANCNPLAVDLLQHLLLFNPAKRFTVEQALRHPYLASLYDPAEDSTCPSVFQFQFENLAPSAPLAMERLQELIYGEMLSFHPEALSNPYPPPDLSLAIPNLDIDGTIYVEQQQVKPRTSSVSAHLQGWESLAASMNVSCLIVAQPAQDAHGSDGPLIFSESGNPTI
eukprot:GILJ01009035.1.p1 GENE.GILJ01009035.1~~GILJ01009035.1.p1  ORF type:complete len:440 (+),score=30.18 GILJ01009035.1:198-1322(+)